MLIVALSDQIEWLRWFPDLSFYNQTSILTSLACWYVHGMRDYISMGRKLQRLQALNESGKFSLRRLVLLHSFLWRVRIMNAGEVPSNIYYTSYLASIASRSCSKRRTCRSWCSDLISKSLWLHKVLIRFAWSTSTQVCAKLDNEKWGACNSLSF